MLCEYDIDGDFQRWYAYGNYIDEVLIKGTFHSASSFQYYLHDHLYSPVALVYWSGSTINERYEYDAYGNCHVLEPNFAPDPDGLTDCSNPYLFTGWAVDILKIEWSMRSCILCRWLGRASGAGVCEEMDADRRRAGLMPRGSRETAGPSELLVPISRLSVL